MKISTSHDKPKIYRLIVFTLISFILSTLSKPAAIIFPVVLLLLDFYYKRKFDKWIWIEKLPFFTVSIIWGIIAIKAQLSDNLIVDYYPLSQRPFFASYAFLNYIVKLFLPVNISIFYPYPTIVGPHLPYLYYAAPIMVILLFYSVYKTLKHTRLVTFGFLFFFCNLILVLQFLSVGIAIMATRYTYIPYIGLFFIIAMCFDKLYRTVEPKYKHYRQAGIIAIVSFAIVCSYATQVRCEVWENDDTLFTDLLIKFPDDPVALNSKGFLLYEQRKYKESVVLFTKAIRLKPDYTKAYINLINSYIALVDYDNALKSADTAIIQAPQNYNLLTTKGYILSIRQNYSEAIRLYKRSIQINKNNIDGYVRLADVYFQLKDYNNSVNTLDSALKYMPNECVLLNNKGYSLFVMGKYTEAIEYFKSCLRIKPDFTTASVNLSNCYRAINNSSRTKNDVLQGKQN
jgi:tetratricopeptide (TPR) repeat protein